jgi:RimJ/RimL family protein N-acetyltransferase
MSPSFTTARILLRPLPSYLAPEILELGDRLRRASWGRGLATEGSLTLLRHAFDTLDQPAVDACADPENTASLAVMRKCGMRYEATYRHPRVDLEVARYLVLRGRWRAIPSS